MRRRIRRSCATCSAAQVPVVLQGMDAKSLDLVVAWPTRTEHQTWMKALRAAAHGGARVQQGWLHKQGGAKSGVAAHGWRRRHILQPTRGELAYYDSRDALRPLGEISLAGVRLRDAGERRSRSTPLVPALGKGRRRRRPFRAAIVRGGGRRRRAVNVEAGVLDVAAAARGDGHLRRRQLHPRRRLGRRADEWLAASPHSFVEPSIQQAAAAGRQQKSLGYFATAEEAALAVARFLAPPAAAGPAASPAAPPQARATAGRLRGGRRGAARHPASRRRARCAARSAARSSGGRSTSAPSR